MIDIFNFRKKKFKHRVLSIDGGGLKGYFTAYTVWRLQEDFEIDIKNHFDTFAGTSTGALLATAIVTGVEYKAMVETYENGKETIFLKNRVLKRMNEDFYPKYSNEALKNYIRRFFANYNFDDIWHLSKKGLLIYSTNLTQSKPTIFATPNFNKIKDVQSPERLVEHALLASTAAPSFFPTIELKNFKNPNMIDLFVDGAIWANDPALITYGIIKKQFNLEDKDIKILSMGYTRKTPLYIETTKVGKNIEESKSGKNIANLSNLIGTTLSLSSFLNKYILSENLPKTHYKRVEILSEKSFPMDEISEEYKTLAKDAYEDQKEEIREFILRKQW